MRTELERAPVPSRIGRGGPARALLMGVVTVALALPAPVTFAGDVYDGDSIEIEGQPARLYGIDAFDLSQTCLDERGTPWRCGIAAKAALAERIEGQALQCVVLDEDQDGWYVARCVGEDGADLGAYMVRSGLRSPTPRNTWLTRPRRAGGALAPGKAHSCRRGNGARTGAELPPRLADRPGFLQSAERACPRVALPHQAGVGPRPETIVPCCGAAIRPWWRFAPVAITRASTDQMRRVWQ
jgi:endonuclease YncB( thermonuclease family)